MKGKIKGSSGSYLAVITLASVFTMLPLGSSAVLCIGPGGHIAIEHIDAECCSHIAVPVSAEHQKLNEIDLAGNCGNCFDYLLITDGLRTGNHANSRIANAALAQCFADPLSSDLAPAKAGNPRGQRDICAQVPLPDSTPLRC